jgi:hypothetical protein
MSLKKGTRRRLQSGHVLLFRRSRYPATMLAALVCQSKRAKLGYRKSAFCHTLTQLIYASREELFDAAA